MTFNHLKIAFRQLRKEKMYAAIKIGGFSLSIAACFLISLYIRNELSYDKSYSRQDQIFRIEGKAIEDGKEAKWVSFPAPMAAAIKKDFPEVEEVARIMPNSLFPGAGSNQIRPADQTENTFEEGFTYADASFFDILGQPMIYGNPAKALAEPQTMVISKSKADKYFPNQDPIGKIMILNNVTGLPFKITGVIADPPAESHLQFKFYLTQSGVEWGKGEQASWDNNNYTHYILLRRGTDIKAFEKKLAHDIAFNYYLPSMTAGGDKSAEQELATFSLHLRPIADVHLKAYDVQDNLTHGDMRFVWLFGAIAAFILMIACVNFINLSTAKSANRAKEVGLRKVIGSYRSTLINQFLTESMMFSFISFGLAMVLARAILPLFNQLAGKTLIIPWTAWWLAPVLVGAALITGFAAGLYPAFYLSSFKPIQVLRGQLSRGSKNSILRNGLVVFQFTTSIILIISTVVIYSQTHHMLNMKLGYDRDQVLMLQGANTLANKIGNFKEDLEKIPEVKSVSVSDYLPVANTKRNGNSMWNEGKKTIDPGVDAQFWVIDQDYFKTLGIHIVAGKNFTSGIKTDSQSIIINQTMASKLNLKDPVGKKITNGYGVWPVLAVVEDFNFETLRTNVGPLCMVLGNSPSILSVKLNGTDMKKTLASIGTLWKQYSPQQPIRYNFLDQRFANMYADVQRMGNIFTSFAVLAIIIACLGLFALSAFMAEQRSKEIGIRKVLGASVTSITKLMSKDFARLVVLSILIASPISWWAMHQWLQDFSYRVPLSWWIFALAGSMAILIALITVSFQSIKAATADPVESLRAQ